MRSLFARPYLLLTLTALFWSGNMVVGRGVTDQVPPIALAFWRWVISLLCVLPFAWPHWRSQWPLLRTHWKPVVLLGILSVAGYNTFAYIALQYTTATNAAMLNSFIPIATIAVAFAWLGKRITVLEGLGVLVSLTGVLLIVAKGSLATLQTLQFNAGDLWMLVAVITWGLYTAGLQRRPPGVHPMLLLAAFIVVGLVVLAPFYIWEILAGRHITVSAGSISALLYIGIVPSFIGYVFYNAGVAAVGPNRAALFIHLMPVFGTLLAVMFLGERPHLYHFIGVGLIFGGIFLTMRRPAVH